MENSSPESESFQSNQACFKEKTFWTLITLVFLPSQHHSIIYLNTFERERESEFQCTLLYVWTVTYLSFSWVNSSDPGISLRWSCWAFLFLIIFLFSISLTFFTFFFLFLNFVFSFFLLLFSFFFFFYSFFSFFILFLFFFNSQLSFHILN